MLNRNVRKHIAEVDKRMSFLLEDLKEYDTTSEEYQDVADQRTYYYDRLVQITNNNEAQRYLEEQ